MEDRHADEILLAAHQGRLSGSESGKGIHVLYLCVHSTHPTPVCVYTAETTPSQDLSGLKQGILFLAPANRPRWGWGVEGGGWGTLSGGPRQDGGADPEPPP